VHALAIIGLCQLLHTEIPVHAAVDETVNATRLLRQPRAAGLVNALLRRCLREQKQLCEDVDRDLAVRTAHPRWLVDALCSEWPDAYRDILAANNERPPLWIRVNRQRISGREYRRLLETRQMDIAASAHADECLLLQHAVNLTELPGFAEGQVSVQDAAAQLAARLVAPQPGERVLDACAAPGGKTCHLLELEPSMSEVVALDISAARLRRVEENLQRLGVRATLIEGDAAIPTAWWDGKPFDRILLDVPCSATGVIRRHPDIKLLRRPEDIAALALRQAQLLAQLWPLLAPGGRLVYASCSALRAENAAVVDSFLARYEEARDVTPAVLDELGMSASAETGYRIAAGTAGMDGFYYACLENVKRR
jgi:16S rRNA (cytosine967-C5)-methyltransferase